MIILIFLIAHWYGSLFCQTFFHHRYSAHGMFTMNKFWERFFYVVCFFLQGSSYLSAYAYGALHRAHHAYTDTELDPHSPRHDGNVFRMMWRTRLAYNSVFDRKWTGELRFLKNLPEWHIFDMFASMRITRVLWSFAYIAFYVVFATEWWMYLFIPIHILMGPIHGVIINWFAHKYGSVNFEQHNDSKNLFPVDLLMMGEGYHNNHHMHPSRANFGWKWYEFDMVYPIIIILHKLNIIQMKRA